MALVPPHTHPRHEHSQYATLADVTAAGLFLPITGGTLTGNLTVAPASGEGIITALPASGTSRVVSQSPTGTALLEARAVAGQAAALYLRGGADALKVRWALVKNNAAETGSNAGGDLSLVSYDDAGVGLYTALSASRSTGLITVKGDPTTALGVATRQYVDNADATKAPLTGGGTSGTWPISITGNAGSVAGLAVHAGRNNEANKIVRTDGSGYLQVGYVNSSLGDENNASGPPRIWGTNGSDNYMRSYQSAYLNQVHSHSRTGAGYGAWSVDVGSLAAGTSYGPWTVGHAWPGSPSIILSDAVFDDGVHSVDTSIGTWDTVNTGVTAKNNHTAAESCVIVGISVI